MPGTHGDVVVVGAGIVGISCALELARRGCSVFLLEADKEPSGASCRAMGWVGIYDDTPEEIALCKFALERWEEIAPQLPASVEFTRRGALWIAETADDLTIAESKLRNLHRAGVEAQLLDQESLHREEPNLRPGLLGGVLVPNDIILDAPEATRFLLRRAVEEGVELRTGCRVRELSDDGVVLMDGSSLRAEHTVLAAGWQSPRLWPPLRVRPRKGQIARTLARPGLVRHQLSEVRYFESTAARAEDSIALGVQPRRNGQYLLGTTRHYAGSSLEVDPSLLRRTLERIGRFVPALADVPLESVWVGLRPASVDSVPLIGPWPGRSSLLIATGHEGIGITTSLATARLIADVVDRRPPPVSMEPFRPNRSGA